MPTAIPAPRQELAQTARLLASYGRISKSVTLTINQTNANTDQDAFAPDTLFISETDCFGGINWLNEAAHEKRHGGFVP